MPLEGQPARFAEPVDEERVRCRLCPHQCVITEGHVGHCGARGVREGQFRALTYGSCSSIALDPIEKKPLYHFSPGREILSIGGWGCNLACRYCQNHGISQHVESGRRLLPDDVLRLARGEPRSIGVAFTYNEPLVWFEFVMDCARLLREAGLAVVLVTNGFISPEPLAELVPWIDAANVDLKSFDESFYADLCSASLAPVMESIRRLGRGCHLEVTKLLVTGHGDPVADAENIARWLAQVISPETPLHLSRYFPRYRWHSPETSPEVLDEAFRAASQHLNYVYVGNAHRPGTTDTRCPDCGRALLERTGLGVRVVGLTTEATCDACGRAIPVRGMAW